MMKIVTLGVCWILFIQVHESAVITDKMRMDEVIMEAAASHEMFDLIHMMDGQMMTMIELDIAMTLSELYRYKKPGSSRVKRKATSNDDLLWPNCTVYYSMTRSDFSNRDRGIIMQAIADWQNFTCLTFKESNSEPNRINFRDGGGCYSRLGRVRGVQSIALAPGCRFKGIVVHEIGHAIGWIHEQARPDRDDFITINFDQIPSNWRSQFSRTSDSLIDDRNVTYDYDSIMHYSGNVFGPRTIVTRDPAAQDRLGQRLGLSFRDIKIANLMYNCAGRCGMMKCPGEGFMTKECKCVCPGPLGNPLVPCPDTPMPSTTTTEPTPTTTLRPPAPECRDLRSNCAELRVNGGCESDPARMSIFCRETCDLCGVAPQCMDYDEACPFFANSGFCSQQEVTDYFRQECPLSCGVCEPTDACFRDPNTASSTSQGLTVFGTLVMISAARFL